jgi:DNA-binding IscR family transcriptional regulator
MILRLTEGSLSPVPCIEADDEVNCDRQEDCVTLILWKKINEAVRDVVDSTTLQDLVDWQRAKDGDYII